VPVSPSPVFFLVTSFEIAENEVSQINLAFVSGNRLNAQACDGGRWIFKMILSKKLDTFYLIFLSSLSPRKSYGYHDELSERVEHMNDT